MFTDLSKLATCDYSLMFNRPIKVFMECGAFAVGLLAQHSSGTKHFHSKLNCVIITTSQGGFKDTQTDLLKGTQPSKGRGHSEQI